MEDVFASFPAAKPKTGKDKKALEEAKKLEAEKAAEDKLEQKFEENDTALGNADAW
jgi:hypothetical protein